MIHLWVVNDLAHNKEPAILKNFARGVREIDRAFDPVTEAKLFREAHGCIAHGNDSTCPTHLIDDVALVMRLHLFLHRSHHVRGAQIDFLARCRAAGNKIRTHN